VYELPPESELDLAKYKEILSTNGSRTGNIEIHRESHFFAKVRANSILVDGVKVGTVKDGATTLIPLAPGTHNVTIKLDWKKSNTTTINTEIGQTIKLNVDYKKLTGWKLYALSGAWIATALIGATFGIGWLVGLGVASFFMLKRFGKMHLCQETLNITSDSTVDRE
jgi:hypothetical protein